MARSGSGKTMAVRLVALLVVAAGALLAVLLMRSPLAIDEAGVQRMLARGELVGLSVEDAAARLQHRPPHPPVSDGIVILDFRHIRGWGAGGVELEVQNGRIAAARWETPAPPPR
jgi:hypothetical protein